MTDRAQLQETEAETPLHTSDLLKSKEQSTSMGDEHATPVDEDKHGSTPLFATNEADSYRSRWEKIQAGFVDEPRQSVERADELVAAVIKRLAEVFADERSRLERDWEKNESVSTEELRIALRRYRSFFDRLLTV